MRNRMIGSGRRAYEQLDSGYSTRRVDEDATRRQGLDAAIGADNMGHQMLQQMGWREGGLGRAGRRIAEPIGVRQQQSNQGVGAQQAQQQPQDEFRNIGRSGRRSTGAGGGPGLVFIYRLVHRRA